MMESLESIDRELFLWLNGFHQPWLDQVMYYMTDELYWIPLYVLLLFLIYKSFNLRIALFALLGVAIVVTLGDRISVELFKEVFKRYRPTHNLEIAEMIHTVNGYRGGMYSFVSSHATNFFGVATFLFCLISKGNRYKVGWLFVWAGLISYTRIYLGVHYPSDIICGGILGFIIGYFVFRLFNRFILKKK